MESEKKCNQCGDNKRYRGLGVCFSCSDLNKIEMLEKQVNEARKVIMTLKRCDYCWCDMAIGNPMVRNHSTGCKQALKFLKSLEE